MFARIARLPTKGARTPVTPTDTSAILGAIRDAVAYIEFTPDGTVLEANSNFLDTVGHSREAVVGQHHRMFCDAAYARSIEYRQFWRQLASGNSHAGTFPRITRAGNTIWLEATYFPVRDADGEVYKVVKIASDVTAKMETLQDQAAVFEALDRSLAVIEFTPDGTILKANDNFLQAVGYRLQEIQGQHHRMFCDDDFYRQNPNFWQELARGRFMSGKFRRFKSSGEELWLEATYNPILDEQGRTVKVVKFATDITTSVHMAERTREASAIACEMAQKTADGAKRGEASLEANVANSEQIRQQVAQTKSAIDQLNAEARNIESIIETIRNVAETTKMLSLNAAIEAARAGAQGHGFAVVAQEVRKLASSTRDATSQIAEVIHGNLQSTQGIAERIDTVNQVAEQGRQQVLSVQQIMAEIREGASHVVESVSSIPRA
ncbi:MULTISPECIES: PAS domain-containing methyl-accepting chemotaxis protein [unclassified Thioalkalivibrio]|uniref:methyl-accepting chemotaxis protein n=1 Tax=unclassified Thioalkalivibrio TaxID=2621013 RepID=UPI00035EDAA7|nr:MULTISPECIES: PAS domain-containing methyl-accepting chemotaxis protein [unclassified Thioalkalivibrio]